MRACSTKAMAAAVSLAAAGACALGAVTAVPACIPDLPDNSSKVTDASLDGFDASFDAAIDTAVDSQDTAAPALPYCGDGIVQLDRGEQCDIASTTDAGSVFCTGDCKMTCPTPEAGGFLWTPGDAGSQGNNHCYSYDGYQASSLDQQASNHCAGLLAGTHVVTFASEAEFQAVVAALDAGPFWVGLAPFAGFNNNYTPLALYEPGWSPTCSGCFAHTPTPALALPGTSPQGCVESLADAAAAWQQYPCSAAKIGVLCEREPLGALSERCDAGLCIDLVWTHLQKRYVYIATKATAAAAEARCESLGGTLIVLQSRDEREQIWFALERTGNPPSAFWIGLSQQDGGWVWADGVGSDAYASPWGANLPVDGGLQAYVTYSMTPPTPVDDSLARNFGAETNLMPFVCQTPVTGDF